MATDCKTQFINMTKTNLVMALQMWVQRDVPWWCMFESKWRQESGVRTYCIPCMNPNTCTSISAATELWPSLNVKKKFLFLSIHSFLLQRFSAHC